MLSAEIISVNPLFIAGKFTINFSVLLRLGWNAKSNDITILGHAKTKKVGDTEGSGSASTEIVIFILTGENTQ